MPKQNPYKNSKIGGQSGGSSSQNNSRPASPPRPTTTYDPPYNSYARRYRSVEASQVWGIILPILFFIVGQILLYVVFVKTQRVLVFDLVFSVGSTAWLALPSILAGISLVHVIVRSYKLMDDGDHFEAWLYILISGVVFIGTPAIAGFPGIILTAIISGLIENVEEEHIPVVCLVFAVVIGLVIYWTQYLTQNNVLILSNLVGSKSGFNIKTFSIIMTILVVINTIILSNGIYNADNYDALLMLFTLLPFCIFVLVCPTITAIPLFIYSIIARYTLDSLYDELRNTIVLVIIFSIICIILLIVLGCAGNPKNIADKFENEELNSINVEKVMSFEEMNKLSNNEVFAVDISEMETNIYNSITLSSSCETVVIVGNSKKTYKGFTIYTSAENVFLDNLKVEYGSLHFTAENTILSLYGDNEFTGENGDSGFFNGEMGEDGDSAVYAKNLTITGKGKIKLKSGAGGQGATGSRGSDGQWWWSNGSDGGKGSRGGDSGYVINCRTFCVEDFSGHITLIKGAPGSGGSGGSGGTGGWWASDGNKGPSGDPGGQKGYSNIKIDIEERFLTLE